MEVMARKSRRLVFVALSCVIVFAIWYFYYCSMRDDVGCRSVCATTKEPRDMVY